MRILIVLLLVIVGGYAAFQYSRSRPSHSKQALETPMPFSVGMSNVDEILNRDFINDRISHTVLVKSSGAHPDEKMGLEEFITEISKDLGCPDCSFESGCKDSKNDSQHELCFLEWSRSSSEQKEGQDLEPGSIWTLEYMREKTDAHRVVIDSLVATWRDF